MATPHPFTFDIYRSERDGAWVIHIETPDELEPPNYGPEVIGPSPLRVYVNDGDPIYANPDLPDN